MLGRSILARLEELLRAFVEGGAERLFPAGDLPSELASCLEQALCQGGQLTTEGERLAPNQFTILLPPALVQAAGEDALLRQELAQQIEQMAVRLNYRLVGQPLVKILANPEAESFRPVVLAGHVVDELAETAAIEVETSASLSEVPSGAYLVVNGLQIFPLNQALISIGRDSQNDLVLTDERVSRLHAQLRAVHGQYHIFDLDSTGGTFVNGQLVTHQMLFPGDVISLAGVPLVYGQEKVAQAGQTEEILS